MNIDRTVLTGASKILALTIIHGAILILVSGSLRWTGAWLLLGGGILYLLLMMTVGMAFFPDVVRARATQSAFEHPWDRRALLVYFVALETLFVVAALDHRFQWTSVARTAQIVGAVLFYSTYVLSFLVVATNRFAIGTSRVQENQRVVDRGPYRVVRHPMYSGTILFCVGAPLLLSSLWAYLPATIIVGAIVYRTWHEDRMLTTSLSGYAAYRHRVKYRLVPLLW